jgi:hypothetical protein
MFVSPTTEAVMTIAILKLEADQRIARPFSRACSTDEMLEILRHWRRVNPGATAQVPTNAFVDSENPVMEHAGAKFYAFTE